MNNKPMDYSPKLREAMEEVKAVLKKYDIAATVVLHTPGYAEYLHALSPSYSYVSTDAETIRITTKKSDSLEVKQEKLTNSANMLKILCDTNKMLYRNLERVSYMLDEMVEAEHE